MGLLSDAMESPHHALSNRAGRVPDHRRACQILADPMNGEDDVLDRRAGGNLIHVQVQAMRRGRPRFEPPPVTQSDLAHPIPQSRNREKAALSLWYSSAGTDASQGIHMPKRRSLLPRVTTRALSDKRPPQSECVGRQRRAGLGPEQSLDLIHGLDLLQQRCSLGSLHDRSRLSIQSRRT